MHSEVQFLLDHLQRDPAALAVIAGSVRLARGELLGLVERRRQELQARGVESGDVVALSGAFSAGSISLLLALIANGNISVPLGASGGKTLQRAQEAQAMHLVRFDGDDTEHWTRLGARGAVHPLLDSMRRSGEPGLVVFTSASTGAAKAAVHSFPRLLSKFRKQREGLRTLTFLSLDHLGGINTLLAALSYGGVAISATERTVQGVCTVIERERVELLPATPTFLKMLLMADAPAFYDLGSLRLITYGSEAMPAATLTALRTAFPHARLKQTYGLTELGVLPTRSEEPGSLWMQVGGEGIETKIVDGTLRIRAATAMLGYLNAPSPFDQDGWHDTGDVVETRGPWIRIVGRRSEMINVGGEKFFPGEVEDFLLTLENVSDASVSAMDNPLIGQLVVASVRVREPEDPARAEARILADCSRSLEPHKVPVTIRLMTDTAAGERFKKVRMPGISAGRSQ